MHWLRPAIAFSINIPRMISSAWLVCPVLHKRIFVTLLSMSSVEWFTKEQQRILDFMDASNRLKSFVQNHENDLLLETFNGLQDAVILFGKCEMAIQRSQRLDDTEEAAGLMKRGMSYNRRGMASLEAAIESIQGFQEDTGGYDEVELSTRDEDIAYLREEATYQLAQLYTKPRDVERLTETFQNALNAVVEDGIEGLGAFTEENMQRLLELRGSESRGTEENIPVWKIVAVAAFFGITLWTLMKCKWRWYGRRCTWKEDLIYALIAKAAALGYKLC